MMLEGLGFVVIGAHTYNYIYYMGLSVEVQYSALVCDIACVVIYWYSYLSRVSFPASNISVCSLRVLEEEEPQ